MTEIANAIELFDWTPVLEFLTIFGIMLVAYQMQYTEKFETELRLDHGPVWSQLRRLAFAGKALGMIWCVIYAHTHQWRPWPPFVLVVAAVDLYIFVQIMIMRIDVRRASRRGSVLG